MAMIVWRVTPIRCASSAWVISPCSNRNRRIWLLTFVGLPNGLETSSIGDDLDGRHDEREVHRVPDPEVLELRQRQDERHDHADAEHGAGEVLAEAPDVAVAD